MGTRVNAQGDADSEYVKNIYMVNKVVFRRIRDPLLRMDAMFKWKEPQQSKEYYDGVKMMQGFTRDIIRKRMQQRKYDQENADNIGQGQEKKRTAFLDLLLECYDKGEIDFEGIREEVDTFLFEGHDTTSAALNMAFFEIARNPRVKKKLQDELDELFRGDVERNVTNDDLNNMPYCDAFIREILRLYPSVPIHGRTLQEPCKINDKYTLPAGVTVFLQPYLIHRDPKHWGEDAEECKPERFLDDSVKRHAYAWVPFSAGSRNCIGQRFAMMEMKMQVSSVMRRFDFSIAEGEKAEVEMYGDMILRPWENAKLKIEHRKDFNL